MKSQFNISCKESSFLISKQQETRLSTGERVKLFIHLCICDSCKLFKKQTNLILSVLSNKKNSSPTDKKLTAAAKEKMAKKLEEDMKDG